MPPEFWQNLPAIITAASGFLVLIVTNVVTAVVNHRKSEAIEAKVEQNTQLTEAKADENKAAAVKATVAAATAARGQVNLAANVADVAAKVGEVKEELATAMNGAMTRRIAEGASVVVTRELAPIKEQLAQLMPLKEQVAEIHAAIKKFTE